MSGAFVRESITYVSVASAGAFLLVCALVFAGRYGWERRRQQLKRLDVWLRDHAAWVSGRTPWSMLERMTLATLQGLVVEPAIAPAARRSIASELLRRLGMARVVAAARAGGGRARDWQRIWALRILAHTDSPQFWRIVELALEQGSPEVIGSSIALLGQLADRRAAAILARILRASRFARARIATALEAFPMNVPEIIAPMLDDEDAHVRYWGALLMRRYPAASGPGNRLVALTSDGDAFVRKAALMTLAVAGGAEASDRARACLDDPAPFVRAQAARTLAALGRTEAAGDIARLLAEKNWWVRLAAKQSLEALGAAAAPAIVPWLSHEDRFARNGAAEVLQNTGLFEQLVRAETTLASDVARVELLGRVTRAGGVDMWAAVIPKLPAAAQGRARALAREFGAHP